MRLLDWGVIYPDVAAQAQRSLVCSSRGRPHSSAGAGGQSELPLLGEVPRLKGPQYGVRGSVDPALGGLSATQRLGACLPRSQEVTSFDRERFGGLGLQRPFKPHNPPLTALCLKIHTVGRKDELCFRLRGRGALPQRRKRLRDLSRITCGDVNVVGLKNTAKVGLVRCARTKPPDGCLLVIKSFKEGIRKVPGVKRLVCQLRNGFFYFNGVQLFPPLSCDCLR